MSVGSANAPGRRLASMLAAAALATSLGACSYFGDMFAEDEIPEDPPVETLYAQADAALKEGNERRAAQLFDDVERLYPTSKWAKRSIIMSAYASYEYGDYDKAALTAQRFLEFFPSDKDAAYAQYIIAISHYDQIADVSRDQARTQQALQALRELINRYPESEYAREARLKLDLTLDHLAGKEMDIGRFYLKRAEYVAAINRFRTVVTDYQTTSHTPEALHRLVEAYLALGVEREAKTAAAVLGHNFPGSPWYADSYALLTGRDLTPEADSDSWLARVYERVVKGEWL